MDRKITWLHFSDLHYGQNGQNILLPKIKRELFKDIEFIKNELGKIDVVFFSGDLTQSGKKEEFDELTVFLNEMWALFRKLGSNPYLIAIPGNHDLTRPDQTKAVVKVLMNYQSDEELKDRFWKGIASKDENYELIYQCFKNFDEWYSKVDLPKPDFKFGLIPGDVSTCIYINDIQLNVIGLNTAFLELSNGDYLGKLVISPEQVIAITSKNPLEWSAQADLALFMTHHDPNWYDERSKAYYNNDINPPGTFYSHLCGHLHEPKTVEHRLIGSEPRRTQIAPSLFGLHKINNNIDRIHGYYAGCYIIREDDIYEKFYPRIANKQYDGNYGIVADNGFNLRNKNFIDFTSPYVKAITNDHQEQIAPLIASPPEALAEENILDLKATLDNGKELDKIPKVSYAPLPQHKKIRLVEQRDFTHLIKKNSYAWLLTDWGLNEAGFIGSVSDELQFDKIKSGFILNCEDIVNEKELISAFQDQFGMTLQRFCNITTGLKNTLLVLDHVSVNLYASNNAYYRFLDIIKSITDFCPGIYVIIIARQVPTHLTADQYIRLLPLDSSEIKSYVNNYPGSIQELESSEHFLKLVEITSGLPKHIDRIIESLKVATFEELLESEKEESIDLVNIDPIPKSLKQAISNLADTTDKMKLRSFKLLKILTILANGETFGNLDKFDATEPIYIQNANELEKLSLMEVITTTKILSKVMGNSTQEVKILRAPRQIRDYVNTLITENERDRILKCACDLYFGNKWRLGEIKNIYSSSSLFGTSKFFNVDNCHLITNSIMANAIRNNLDYEIERAASLAINFCTHVLASKDYKNAISTSEEIYNWLKPTNFNRLKAINARHYGQALRMTGNWERSNQIFKESLEIEQGNFSNDEKNSIYVELGFTYILQQKFDEATKCANAILKTADPKGADGIQAKLIKAEAALKNTELLKRLKTLESEAKKAELSTLVNSISLKISSIVNDVKEREVRFSKILASKGDDYNKVRAIIRKSLDALAAGNAISSDELNLLNMSYSYLYIQRLDGLFTDCHKALWIYCVKDERVNDLLNLFKHSSLIWRISDDLDIEKEYYTELNEIMKNHEDLAIPDSVNSANVSYYIRRKLEFESLPTPLVEV